MWSGEVAISGTWDLGPNIRSMGAMGYIDLEDGLAITDEIPWP